MKLLPKEVEQWFPPKSDLREKLAFDEDLDPNEIRELLREAFRMIEELKDEK